MTTLPVIAVESATPATPAAFEPDAIEVRWSLRGSIAPDHDRINGTPLTAGDAPDHLMLHLQPLGNNVAIVQAVLEHDGKQRTILSRSRCACAIQRDGHWLHIDLHHDGSGLLKLTLDDRGRAIYLHSPLPTRAGLPGGGYDRPQVTTVTA